MIDCNKQDCNTCPINGDIKDVSSEDMRKLGLCVTLEEEVNTHLLRWGC